MGMIHICKTCKWRSDTFTSVCVNGESERRADFVCEDDSCEKWEEKEMDKRERVIYDIERCICRVPDACRDCSKYSDDSTVIRCMEELLKDALTLLKTQEPRVMTLEEVLAWAETQAEKRDPIFFEQKEGKGPSGWICNSLCPKDYYLCCLDKDARCWTSRPTNEQKEETKWD